jgi:hypothetical protein
MGAPPFGLSPQSFYSVGHPCANRSKQGHDKELEPAKEAKDRHSLKVRPSTPATIKVERRPAVSEATSSTNTSGKENGTYSMNDTNSTNENQTKTPACIIDGGTVKRTTQEDIERSDQVHEPDQEQDHEYERGR